MAYSSQADLLLRASLEELIQLTDDNNLGVVDWTMVDGAIAEADGVIDSFLRAQVEVPLTSTPALIAGVSADLTLYRLMARRGLGVTAEVARLKEQAFHLLEQVSKGELKLFGTDTKTLAGSSRLSAREAEFGPDLLGRY